MKDLLNHLREKPEAEKQGIAFGVAGTITLVVFIFWIVYFTSRLDNIEPAPALSEDSVSFVEQLEEGIGLFKDNLDTLKDNTEGVILEDGEVFVESQVKEFPLDSASESTENVLD